MNDDAYDISHFESELVDKGPATACVQRTPVIRNTPPVDSRAALQEAMGRELLQQGLAAHEALIQQYLRAAPPLRQMA